MHSQKYAFKLPQENFAELFEEELARLRTRLGEDIQIEHFGSSAVPGLGGKGIIDIYVVTPLEMVVDTKGVLQELGYEFRLAGGDARRFFSVFVKKGEDGSEVMYHLHLTDNGNPNFEEMIALREFWKAFPEEREAYADIKRVASEKALEQEEYQDQKRVYQATKYGFLEEQKKRALGWWKVLGK